MRFLKQKIALACQARQTSPLDNQNEAQEQASYSCSPVEKRERIKTRKPREDHQEEEERCYVSINISSSNNIMKNYCRALTNFAVSRMAVPYLRTILQKEKLNLDEFINMINQKKRKINCIKNLREILLIQPADDEKMIGLKRAFKAICEIFLKQFSVNWVFNSKINDKITHLFYRFKILRRIRNPEYFTYLEGFSH